MKTEPKTGLNKVINRVAAGLAFTALAINCWAAWKVHYALPAEDAGAYRAYAWAYGQTTGLIGVREPAPVFAVKVLTTAGLPTAAAAKVLGLAAFAALAILTFLVLKRRYGPEAGALGALFLGANPYFSYYAMKGPADILPILFFLAFWELAERGGSSYRNLAWTAVFGALAALSKIIFFLFVLYALAAGALADRAPQRWKFNARVLLLALALVSPYLIWQAAAASGPLSLQANTLRYWRNLELQGPVLEAPYAGGPLGPAAFVFADGAFGAAARLAAGLKKTFLSVLPRLAYYYGLELYFGLLGCALLLLKRDWLPVSLFFVFILPAAFIAAINQAPGYWGIEPRFFLPAFWLVCFFAGYGFQQLVALASGAVKAWAQKLAAER